LDIISRHHGPGEYLFNAFSDGDSDKIIEKKLAVKLSSLAKQIKNIAKELELPPKFSFQYARHSYATEMIKGGISLKAISETMGHTNAITTENYIKV